HVYAYEIKPKVALKDHIQGYLPQSFDWVITVGPRSYSRFGRDIAPRAGPVLDDKLLAEPFRQPLRDEPCTGVEWAASGIADENAHRPRRIGLRSRNPRHSRQRGRARGQMQKISAGKFHCELPSCFTSFDHLVGAEEDHVRNFKTNRLCSFHIEHKLETRCLIHGREYVVPEVPTGEEDSKTERTVSRPRNVRFLRVPLPQS